MVAAVVARALGAPLDLVLARKVGHPMSAEYAIAAVTEDGTLLKNEEEVRHVDQGWFEDAVRRERQVACRRRTAYLEGRPPLPCEGKTAIVVDDGIATGLTMRAAVASVRKLRPARLVVAVPTSSPEAAERLAREADEVVAVMTPSFFTSTGGCYERFNAVSDDEVIAILRGFDQP